MLPRSLSRGGVSTALATIAIISVLIMSLSWMAYTVVLNARQQAAAAERAESIALKAKELIRVYVWLDPARQPDGRYLNLTRISFVGSWSGETTINGLLVVYRDGSSRMLGANIKLAAGEERTYLPSELGIPGLDNYDAFRGAVKYVQAHTSLGNDFVSLWGRPDKPAIYFITTTPTTTTTTPPTTTTTTTTPPPTTTTTTTPPTTSTSTSTVTSTVTRTTTATVTSTSTVYHYTRCTTIVWEGALSTETRTVTSTVTSWRTNTFTITDTTTSTVTSTLTSTVRTTSTSTITHWAYTTRWVTSTYWVTSTTTWTFTSYSTVWTTTTARYIRDSWYQGPSLEPADAMPCGFRIVVVSGSGMPVRPDGQPSGQTSPEALLAIMGLVFFGSYERRVRVRRFVSVLFSPHGLAALLLIAVFTAGPVMEAAAQTTTTTVTTTVTSTSYVTVTSTITSTVCTATTTVTSTTTGTITTTSYVYVTTTTGPTTYVTSTVTQTTTAYATVTVTSTYYTSTIVTSTRTDTFTSTVTSTTTSYVYTTRTIIITSTVTSSSTYVRCGPWCHGTQSCDCVYPG